MRRRDFTVLLVGVVAWPHPPPTQAQTARKMYRIGWLGPTSPTPEGGRLQDSFRQGMRDHGHVEGRDYVIEFRYAHGRPEQVPDLAAELVRLPTDVIVAVTSHTAHAAKGATTTIPILLISPDPLSTGLVTNLARPGGNITGVTMIPGPEIVGKYLQLITDTVQNASRVAMLWNETSPWQSGMIREAEAAARALRLQLQAVAFRQAGDFETAFVTMETGQADAVIVLPDGVTFVHRKRLADLALKHRLPALMTHLDAIRDGSLMAFATNLNDLFQRAANYVDRLMKGEKAGDLPVEQPTRYILAINLKTAAALGLAIPPAILARADEVIE